MQGPVGCGRRSRDTSSDALWDDWDRTPRVPATPEAHLDGFVGSLDLLLVFPKRERIDLNQLL